MTSSSSSPEDSPLPKKHRPNLGELSQETTERDLWDFSEELENSANPSNAGETNPETPDPAAEPPPPRKAELPAAKSKAPTADAAEASDLIRVNVSRPKPKVRRGIPAQERGAPEDVFEDLETWSDARPPSAPEEDLETPEPPPPQPEPAPAAEAPQAAPVPAPPAPPAEEDLDELNPHTPAGAAPISLQPRISLSKVERIGLITLAVVLVTAAALAYWFSINRIPSGRERLSSGDFPIRGETATVRAADTYWRAPITDGTDTETVRRGTVLVPVIELKTENKPGVLRVVFHDDTGAAVGDITTREIRSESMTVAATAGFDELGMHAAYRTGSIEPWTVEVLEGRPGSTRGEEFRKLFEIEISALRR